MPTLTDIINLALVRIGNDAIVSIDESSQPARVAKRIHAMVRDSVIREFPWNFAQRRGEILASVADAATDDYAYAYAYPPTALHIWRVYSANTYADPSAWTKLPRELTAAAENWVPGQSAAGAKIILCNIEMAKCDYTVQVTNPAMYEPLFVDAFAWRLAGEMSTALTADDKKLANCMNMYQRTLSLAWGSQAAEMQQAIPRYSPTREARR